MSKAPAISGCPHCKRDVPVVIMTNGDTICRDCLKANGISYLTENDFSQVTIEKVDQSYVRD